MKAKAIPTDVEHWESRVWSLVERCSSEECWPWLSSRNKHGRAMFSCCFEHRSFVATRLIWCSVHQHDPGALNVLHKCDHPWCCNPTHLWLGTQKQNVMDMIQKGRKWMPIGEKHGRAKLSDAKVRAIRRSRKTNVALAEKYGVSDLLISLVKRRLIWKHVA